MELNLQKFNEAKANFTLAIQKFSSLDKEIENIIQLKQVSNSRKELKNLRVSFSKFAKSERDGAIKYQKSIIEQEKEGLSIIEPIEQALQKREDEYLEKLELEKRKKTLPIKKQRLEALKINISDEEILKMDDKEFEEFFEREKQVIFEREQEEIENQRKKLEKEKQDLEDEKKRIEDEKQRLDDLEKARKEGEEKALNEVEKRKIATDKEIERLSKIDDYNYLREQRIVFSTSISYEKERLIDFILSKMKEIQEKKDQERLEKQEKYKEFLEKNSGNYDKILKEDGKIVLYKKVDEFIISNDFNPEFGF